LVFRNATRRPTLTLVVGPPGSGKSTWAAAQPGVVVIDRDVFVLTEDGYDPAGRAESVKAAADALRAGDDVLFVACLMSPGARAATAAAITADAPADVAIVAIEAPRETLVAVNANRKDSDRGQIPPDQLEHMLDAWQTPTEDEARSVQILNTIPTADV
jgi:predicted kinase